MNYLLTKRKKYNFVKDHSFYKCLPIHALYSDKLKGLIIKSNKLFGRTNYNHVSESLCRLNIISKLKSTVVTWFIIFVGSY